ncbi:MAG: formate dehydrogenase accessory sulfurtransferase FdhD [Anaerolineae bacterium]|nr:formate dehydrogenase accessory sulfurtransferase FdhD [Anaerolineae bacterium]
MEEQQPGAVPYTYWALDGSQVEPIEGGLIAETLVTIYVNAQEVATVMCSPVEQEALAVGFLYNEGVIDSSDQVTLVKANVTRTAVDVFLNHNQFTPPRRMILTSGCGGGVTWQDWGESYPALNGHFIVKPEIITARMRDMQGLARLYHEVRGVHIAVLADNEKVLVSAEDIGRHNAVDKVAGKALLSGINMADRILLTSGRISSEMIGKARRMGIPIVASRTSPTSISVQLAQAWNICVVGYVRQGGMRVYTHPHRLGLVTVPVPRA